METFTPGWEISEDEVVQAVPRVGKHLLRTGDTSDSVAHKRPVRVLVVFNAVSLYGMERATIETFDLLRPEVEPFY